MLATVSSALRRSGAEPRDSRAASSVTVSLSVSDLQRSADYYQKVFGLAGVEPGQAERDRAAGPQADAGVPAARQPEGVVDHFAIGVREFQSRIRDRRTCSIAA